MKELNPLLHSQLRLGASGAWSRLVVNMCGPSPTAGNLSVQLDKLSAAGYISIEKGFVGRKTRTTARITTEGRDAFEEYVEALKQYISMQ